MHYDRISTLNDALCLVGMLIVVVMMMMMMINDDGGQAQSFYYYTSAQYASIDEQTPIKALHTHFLSR